MDYTKLSGDILAAVGGKENVLGNMVCMTRLRIKVSNPAKVNSEAVKAIDGVMGLSRMAIGLRWFLDLAS